MMFSLSSPVRAVSRADNKSRPDKQKNRTGILGIIDMEGGREGGKGEGGEMWTLILTFMQIQCTVAFVIILLLHPLHEKT